MSLAKYSIMTSGIEILLPPEIKLLILKNLPQNDALKMRLMSRTWEKAANEYFFTDDNIFHFRPDRDNLARLAGLAKTDLFVQNIREVKIHIGDFDPNRLLRWFSKQAWDGKRSLVEIQKMARLVARPTSNRPRWNQHLDTTFKKLPSVKKLTIDGWGCPWKGEEEAILWDRMRDHQSSTQADWREKDLSLHTYVNPILDALKAECFEELVLDAVPVEVLNLIVKPTMKVKYEENLVSRVSTYEPRDPWVEKFECIKSLTIRARRGDDEVYTKPKLGTIISSTLNAFQSVRSLTLDFPFSDGNWSHRWSFTDEWNARFRELEFPALESLVLGEIHIELVHLRTWLYKYSKILKKLGFMTNVSEYWARDSIFTQDIFSELRSGFNLNEFFCNHFVTIRAAAGSGRADYLNLVVSEV